MRKKYILLIFIILLVIGIIILLNNTNKKSEETTSHIVVDDINDDSENEIIRNAETNEIMYEVPKGDAYMYKEDPNFSPSFGEQIKSEKKKYSEN